MDHTAGQRLKQSTICTRPGLSQRVLAPAPPPAHWSQSCPRQSILPPSLSQLWCTPRLYLRTSHSVDICGHDLSSPLPATHS